MNSTMFWPLGVGGSMKTALITGVTGQDGSYLAEEPPRSAANERQLHP
jgi:hypothetical protein